MESVKEIRIPVKNDAVLVYKKIETAQSTNNAYYDYYLLVKEKNGHSCVHPPNIFSKKLNMSVQDYKSFGRPRWFDFVKISDHAKARKILDDAA